MKIVLVGLLGFAPFILALQTESADDCAVEDEATILPLLVRALDPSYECHNLNDGNLSTGPQVYNIVGCNEPDASWNYNYQTDDLSKGRSKKLFNGLSTISFDSNLGNSKYRFGLKHNKCIKPFWNNVKQIKGNIMDDKFQGSVVIKFFDETFVTVFAKDNFLTGVSRHFSMQGKQLLNVSDAVTNQVLWVRDRFGSFRHRHIQGRTERVLVTKDFQSAYDCDQHDSIHLVDCRLMSRIHSEFLESDGCSYLFSNLDYQKASQDIFKVNGRTGKRVNSDFNRPSNCPETTNWNTENIGASILEWKNSVLDEAEEDFLWYFNHSSEPLDLSNPRINITLDQWVGRQPLKKWKVKIFGTDRQLLETWMVDGKIQAEVPGDLARLPDWKAPVRISIESDKSNFGANYSPDVTTSAHFEHNAERKELFSATGRLHRGQLDGWVVMRGVVSNDPTSCSTFKADGLGFFGRFKNGKPHGVCWRELLGGGWLHGRVNDAGHFTGHEIAYVYPDLKTAIVGQFERGLLIRGQAAEVVGEKCAEEGIKALKFSDPSGPFYHYNPASPDSFGDEPLVGDPLDNRYTYLNKSEKYPLAGEGMFAREKVPAGTVYSLFGGKMYSWEEYQQHRKTVKNIFKQENSTTSNAKIEDFEKFNQNVLVCNKVIHISPEFESAAKYRGTLGHKVNHSFQHNSIHVPIDTPRFGVIIGLKSVQDLAPGQEFLANYGYTYDSSPRWYKQLFLEYMAELPEEDYMIKVVSLGRTKQELENALKDSNK